MKYFAAMLALSLTTLGHTDTLSCNVNPFGNALVITEDTEVYTIAADLDSSVGYHINSGPSGDNSFSVVRSGSSTDLNGSALDIALTAADMEGDRESELIAVYRRGGDDQLTAMAVDPEYLNDGISDPDSGRDYWRVGFSGLSNLAVAAGNLWRQSNRRDSIAIATLGTGGLLQVYLQSDFGEAGDGRYFSDDGLIFGQHIATTEPAHTSLNFNQRNLDIAVGDFDNDGFNDEIVVAYRRAIGGVRVIVLEVETNPANVAPGDFQMIVRSATNVGIGTPNNIAVASGDIDGDFHDEIVILADNPNPGSSVSSSLRLLSYDVNPGGSISLKQNWTISQSSYSSDLAVGDTDQDSVDEIVVGYANSTTLNVRTIDAEQTTSTPVYHNFFSSGANHLDGVDNLNLAVGDFDNQGKAQIIAAFRNSNLRADAIRLEDTIDRCLPPGCMIYHEPEETIDGDIPDLVAFSANARPLVAIADYNNDSVLARYEATTTGAVQCQAVKEPQINSVVFVPPHWQTINADGVSGTIGESASVSEGEDTSVTSSTSHSIFGYVGAGVDAGVASASLKATAGYEYSASKSETTGLTEGKTLSEGWQNSNDFLVLETSTYHCFSYQYREGDTPLDATARICELQSVAETAPQLVSWDADPIFTSNDRADLRWVPAVREWANLARFNNAQARQSSTVQTAANAIDGSDSVSETTQETNPWIQIDLGLLQPISKVRLLNRLDSQGLDLQNFSLFIGTEDFGNLNDVAALAALPSVSFSQLRESQALKTATFVTLDDNRNPVIGRYIRVVAEGNTALSLREVQAFGPNHLEPDQFPRSVRDTDPNDGRFTVSVFDPYQGDYQDISVAGRLIWDDASVLNGKTIGPGQGAPSWSLTEELGSVVSRSVAEGNSASIGIEMDVEAGAIATVQFGGGTEFALGVETEHSRTLSITDTFEIGGSVSGFPATDEQGNPVLWPGECQYEISPYYYLTSAESDYGFSHEYLVVDYIVPENALDRRRDLSACKADAPTVDPEPSNAVLLAHWKFDGDLLDSSGNGHHGSPGGAAVPFSTGQLAQAADLRTDVWVEVDSAVLNQLPQCSLSVWVSVYGNQAADSTELCCNALFAEDNFSVSSLHFNQLIDTSNFEWAVGGVPFSVNAAVPSLQTWQHLAWTYDQTSGLQQIYVDGVLADTQSNQNVPACGAGTSSIIGAWDKTGSGSMTRYFNGLIDDLRFYSGVLSTDDIALIRAGENLPSLRFCSGFEATDDGNCQ